MLRLGGSLRALVQWSNLKAWQALVGLLWGKLSISREGDFLRYFPEHLFWYLIRQTFIFLSIYLFIFPYIPGWNLPCCIYWRL